MLQVVGFSVLSDDAKNGGNEIHRFEIRLNNKLEHTTAIFVNLFNR